VLYFCSPICPYFSYLLWSLTLFYSYSCTYFMLDPRYLYGGNVLYWGLTYAWACFHLAYVRRHNVPVPTGSGRYIVVSELRFTPGVGNHLGQSLGSYQQYSQVQINWSVSEFGDSSNEYKNTKSLTIHSLIRLYSFLPSSWHPISFLISLHLIASKPLVCVHYHPSTSWVPYRYQSAKRKCRGPVTFRPWGWKSCSQTWLKLRGRNFL